MSCPELPYFANKTNVRTGYCDSLHRLKTANFYSKSAINRITLNKDRVGAIRMNFQDITVIFDVCSKLVWLLTGIICNTCKTPDRAARISGEIRGNYVNNAWS